MLFIIIFLKQGPVQDEDSFGKKVFLKIQLDLTFNNESQSTD